MSLSTAREDLVGKSYVVLTSDITSNIEAKPLSTNSNIDHVIADLYFFPQQTQNLELMTLQPQNGGKIQGNNIEWIWLNEKENLNFGVHSKVKSYLFIAKINKKIPFPLTNLDPNVQQYLIDTAHIDATNPEIIAVASALAQGETDEFTVDSKLAYWARQNIVYDLNTLTADVSQKASWVLKNKKGVCDELTNLFIALNRALGIPARFVSGITYTDSEQFKDPWSPHGWAEVYFPEYGWIPFDPTYGQYGWVDATHIKMRESLDPGDPSTTYEWGGKDVQITTNQLTFDTMVNEIGEEMPELFQIDTEVIKDHIGMHSYDLVSATLTNTQDFYLAAELSISPSEEIEVIDSIKQLIIVPPQEKRKVYWRIKVKPGLSNAYTYTVPVTIYSSRNEKNEDHFEIANTYADYQKQEIDTSYDQLALEEEKKYSKEVELHCQAQNIKFYENQENTITCVLKNLGNVYLENLKVCLEERCRTDVTIGIGQSKRIIFPITWDKESNKEIEVTISNDQITKSFSVELEKADLPHLTIENIIAPPFVKYGEIFVINFTVKRTSIDPPQDVLVTFSRGGVDKIWHVPELHEQRYSITLYGQDFDSLQNTFDISASFTTPTGEKIEKKQSVTIELDTSTVSFGKRIKMAWNKFVNFFDGIFH